VSTKRLVLISIALGVLVVIVVPLHSALRADPAVLINEAYLEPACRVPFQVFPQPLCPRFVAGESPATVIFALIAVPLLARRLSERREAARGPPERPTSV